MGVKAITSSELLPLIQKYSTSGPRYTSYPTAPQWNESVTKDDYVRALESFHAKSSGDQPLAMYVHVPFCEALCYYCGCNIQITKDNSKGSEYVGYLLKELEWTSARLGKRTKLSQISWGGGTPTFLPVEQLQRLFQGIMAHFDLEPGAEVSIEVDPRVTSSEQYHALRELGFNRVSLGLQDFNPTVQKAVNRVQSEEDTAKVIEQARKLGFSGTNLDLIYGLPHQTLETFKETIERVISIRPDRIALYNYAHLPALRPHQKILEKMPMPSADDRVSIFLNAFERLTESGYVPIGMDHFALPNDDLALSLKKGFLYRNFMGYSVKRGAGLIGIGASAIGEVAGGYFQNIRETRGYQEAIEKSGTAVFRGCLLTEDDLKRQSVIQSLMCRFGVTYSEYAQNFHGAFEEEFSAELATLGSMEQDGLLRRESSALSVTELGRLFLRNIAMTFDAYLKKPGTATYSKTV